MVNQAGPLEMTPGIGAGRGAAAYPTSGLSILSSPIRLLWGGLLTAPRIAGGWPWAGQETRPQRVYTN